MKKFVALTVAAAAVLSVVPSGSPVSADPWGSCGPGTLRITNGVSIAVDGSPLASTGTDEYGEFTYVVCRDSKNSAYIINVGRTGGSGGSAAELTSADLTKTFTLTFTPNPAETPHLVEGKGLVESFVVDPAASNTVTVSVKPLAYSDIWGNDCGNKGPKDCVKAVTKASHDSVAAIWFTVRYQDGAGRGREYGLMPGMIWSSSAYDFWPRYSCPAPANGQTTGGVQVEIAGPHLKADGVTENIGYARVYIPATAVANCWGATPQAVLAQLTVTRTENGTTQTATTGDATDSGLEYNATATDEGLTIEFPRITFSLPKYTMRTKSKRSLARSRTSIASLARTLKVTTPRRGRLVVAIDDVSKSNCVAGSTYVFGRTAGSCSYSLTAYRANGTVSKTKHGSFRVR